MSYQIPYTKFEIKQHKTITLLIFFVLFSLFSLAQQVTSSIDSTSIKIGEQITYKIKIEADTTDLVVFPEGQTFLPLEVIESYKVDTTKINATYELIKRYGLTQFDSGAYTIPQQKIVIGDKTIYTDSLRVEVNTVVVDTTKQGLYDIKPILEVKKSPSKWWLYVLLILLVLGAIAFLLYWFIWREKPLTEEEKVALLPPYERAKLALQQLDESNYLEHEEIKEYYSQLTGIIRKYLDEKVYDHSLESTTEELINRLQLLREGNQIDLDKGTISNIESILRRADLVKFAKSKPDIELAKMDRNTVDSEIDHVKESLPEPTEEELLEDLKYQEELAKKKKRQKIIITATVAGLLLIGTFLGFGFKYGFGYVKDSIFGHPTKKMLEGKEWVLSEYGAPGITVYTPQVLERLIPEIPEEFKDKIEISLFGLGELTDNIYIKTSTTKFLPQTPDPNDPLQENGQEPEKPEINIVQASEDVIKSWEEQGVKNIIVKTEQFITPNGAEGLKNFGTANLPTNNGDTEEGNYILLAFTSENLLQQIALVWRSDDDYAQELIDRIMDSIELIKLEEEDK
ncbi:hypothetical protein D7030_06145 [Flavobacteriaceae bacterium AU392]|nr:hypothetical protein D1817_02275 [Flavobacteriaceae bacterium]RKM84714.1 hypothetical protein D7030_06145 [Flavobacteriaceae bacterium AU392]